MKLLVIEPYVTQKSPTMRAWIGAFSSFRDCFEEIEIWATECDIPEGNGVIWKRIPQLVRFSGPHMVYFQWRATRRLKAMPASRDTVVFTSGCNVAQADIRYMQFWNRAMLEEQAKRPDTFVLKLHQRIISSMVAMTEKRVIESPQATGCWWVVSRSLLERIKREGPDGEFRVLPNVYDPARFNLRIRERWRDEMRAFHQIADDEKVLAFSSFGHFERKGLLQAVQAVSLLRERGLAVRVLILGGSEKTIMSFRHKMESMSIAEECCIFAGLVDDIERHLVAGDGFIFPTHFEAFSLAEIEAAALGLRLYLTPHYGSEMILREPYNGRLLPWDPAGMATVIEDDLKHGRVGQAHAETGEALTTDAFAVRIRELFLEAITVKSNATRC